VKYDSLAAAAEHHQTYPALDQDLIAHDFQRRRVAAPGAFVRAGDVVLDVGCNTGFYRSFIPHAAEVHGVDVNPKLVEVAAQRLTSARTALAESLPFPDASFDVVNVSGILEQVYDPAAVLREAARVSRRFVTGTTTHATGTWGKHRIERHVWQAWSYTREEIETLLLPLGTLRSLITVDINHPPEPQCWCWCVEVPR
jgi:ubiquinone/menaquinone biosynthesis C-methylase UbiE